MTHTLVLVLVLCFVGGVGLLVTAAFVPDKERASWLRWGASALLGVFLTIAGAVAGVKVADLPAPDMLGPPAPADVVGDDDSVPLSG